jgi:hypothetical protein
MWQAIGSLNGAGHPIFGKELIKKAWSSWRKYDSLFHMSVLACNSTQAGYNVNLSTSPKY